MDPLALLGYAIVAGVAGQTLFELLAVARRWSMQRRVTALTLERLEAKTRGVIHQADLDRARNDTAWSGWRKFVIDRKVEEAADIWSFYLIPHDRMPLGPFHPGQSVTVKAILPDDPRPLTRAYSLSDARDPNRYYRLTIKKVTSDDPGVPPGRMSSFLIDTLKEGDALDLTSPRGQFHVDPATQRATALVAAGIGLTPIISMLHALAAAGSARDVRLFYGVRRRAVHAMYDELAEIRRQYPHLRSIVCYSRPSPTCQAGRDYDVHGRIDIDLLRSCLPSNNYDFYVCGPQEMTSAVCAGLRRWGVPDRDIHAEAFGAPTHRQRREEPVADGAQGIAVEFSRSGKTALWHPSQGSLLDLAEAQGLVVESACRAGSCGNCATPLKQGRVNYIASPATPPPEGQCLTCIAIPAGPVVLDL